MTASHRRTASSESERGWRLRALSLVVSLFAWFVPMSDAEAQSARSGRQFEPTHSPQFVFLVDDSGSMRMTDRPKGEKKSYPATDPNRYAVLAVRSMLAVLDDDVNATVLRLNGGDDDIAVSALTSTRGDLEALLKADEETAPLAAYRGKNTYCLQGFERMVRALNAAYEKDTPQVGVFLTDGACEVENGRKVDEAANFLGQVKSHADGNFKFYFLRFEGRPYSKPIATWAEESGGAEATLDAKEPTKISQPIAQAITGSQGYDAEILGPSKTSIKAYEYAKSVRLLAMAPEDSGDFSVKLAGKGAPSLREVASGTHAWPGSVANKEKPGDAVRWKVLEFAPTREKTNVVVQGTSKWKIVAIPVYHLTLQTQIQPLKIGDRCTPSKDDVDNVATGGNVCLIARLYNHAGKVVPRREFEGLNLQAAISTEKDGRPHVIELKDADDGGAIGTFSYQNVPEGFQTIDFQAHFKVKTGHSMIRKRRTLQASAQSVGFEQARCSFEAMSPGEKRTCELKAKANFSSLDMQMRLAGRDEEPLASCLEFRINDQPERAPFRLDPGASYQLVARALAFCGFESKRGRLSQQLVFEPARAGADPIKSVVTVEADLDYQVKVSDDSPRVRGGREGKSTTTIATNAVVGGEFVVTVSPESEVNEAGFTLGLFGVDGKPLTKDEAAWVSEGRAVFAGDPGAIASNVGVRVKSDVCCGTGTYGVRLAMRSVEGDAPAFERIVQVPVEYAGLLPCYGKRLLIALTVFLIAMIIWLVVAVETRIVKPNSAVVERLNGRKGRHPNDDEIASLFDGYSKWKIFWKSVPLRILLPLPGVKHCGVVCVRPDGAPPFINVTRERSAVREGSKGAERLSPGLYVIQGAAVLVIDREALAQPEHMIAGDWRVAPSAAGLLRQLQPLSGPGGNRVALSLDRKIELAWVEASSGADAVFAGVRVGGG